MKMQRIVPLMTAALVAGACTGDTTSPTTAEDMLTAPAGPRMEGSPVGGTGGEEPSYNPATTDSTALTRCCQMGGSGG
jgi:hypothetical protein